MNYYKNTIRSYICMEVGNNNYLGIYCHTNSYLSHNGVILLDYYHPKEKVEQLIRGGDLYKLNPLIEPEIKGIHNINNPIPGVSLFYIRDLNKENHLAKIVNLEKLNKEDSFIDCCYIYKSDGNWYYFECAENREIKLKLLNDVVNEYYQELGFPRKEGEYGFLTTEEIEYYKNQENLKRNYEMIKNKPFELK